MLQLIFLADYDSSSVAQEVWVKLRGIANRLSCKVKPEQLAPPAEPPWFWTFLNRLNFALTFARTWVLMRLNSSWRFQWSSGSPLFNFGSNISNDDGHIQSLWMSGDTSKRHSSQCELCQAKTARFVVTNFWLERSKQGYSFHPTAHFWMNLEAPKMS